MAERRKVKPKSEGAGQRLWWEAELSQKKPTRASESRKEAEIGHLISL